jgi:hypothetical protein
MIAVLLAALNHPLSALASAGIRPQPAGVAGVAGGRLGQYLRDPLGTVLAVLVPIGQWLAM